MKLLRTPTGQVLHLELVYRKTGSGRRPIGPPHEGSWALCPTCRQRFDLSYGAIIELRHGNVLQFYACSIPCQLAHTQKLYAANIGKANREKISKARLAMFAETATWYRKVEGVHEHRTVAEKMLGRPLRKGEIVHHKDNDKRNNDPSNLVVMTQSEHCRLHFSKKWNKS